jgi:hypothetical protein
MIRLVVEQMVLLVALKSLTLDRLQGTQQIYRDCKRLEHLESANQLIHHYEEHSRVHWSYDHDLE